MNHADQDKSANQCERGFPSALCQKALSESGTPQVDVSKKCSVPVEDGNVQDALDEAVRRMNSGTEDDFLSGLDRAIALLLEAVDDCLSDYDITGDPLHLLSARHYLSRAIDVRSAAEDIEMLAEDEAARVAANPRNLLS